MIILTTINTLFFGRRNQIFRCRLKDDASIRTVQFGGLNRLRAQIGPVKPAIDVVDGEGVDAPDLIVLIIADQNHPVTPVQTGPVDAGLVRPIRPVHVPLWWIQGERSENR